MKNIDEKILIAEEEIKQLQNKRKSIIASVASLQKSFNIS